GTTGCWPPRRPAASASDMTASTVGVIPVPEYVVPPWSGRRVRRLVNATLAWKGRTCHLCGEPGANSADHDPPRSVLLARGVPNPDDVGLYLWPAHKVCNLRRQKRPVTPELKAELRRRFLREPTPSPDAARSSRFARFFDSTDPSGRRSEEHTSELQ